MPKIFKLSLIISLTGVFLLLLLSLAIQPKQISSYSELKENDYAKVTGKIISIKNFNDFSVIKLDSNITLTCTGCKLKENQTITAAGKVEKYQSSLQISIDKAEIK